MNKFIKEQLQKCRVANIPNYDDNTTKIFIGRDSGVINSLELHQGVETDIEVENYIIHPYPGFTLHDNWNKGIIPTDKQMHILVVQEMGKMICVKAVGLNDNKAWGGWLPKKSCKII